ncbi:hypothetical protein QX249_10485 [Vibrio parahaemolyticus]|uniref:Uncharacterized protein n=1 Tax=Vibrio parahaemolyticus TaxID=670 RepID=A0AAW8PXZ3_VIBPH|nr:hypothetical protein [Vibrio parahaemolyticus]MDS1821087.1 hypothetical protein [Vibrio parahaemolyticus]
MYGQDNAFVANVGVTINEAYSLQYKRFMGTVIPSLKEHVRKHPYFDLLDASYPYCHRLEYIWRDADGNVCLSFCGVIDDEKFALGLGVEEDSGSEYGYSITVLGCIGNIDLESAKALLKGFASELKVKIL